MSLRASAPILAACFLSAAALSSHAGEISIADSCGRQFEGAIGDGVLPNTPVISVDADGNVGIATLASGNYVGGLGQCDALADKPVCSLSASGTKVQRGAQITLYAKCTIPTDSVTWSSGGLTLVDTVPLSKYSKTVTLANPGTYSFSVKGTATAYGTGTASNAVTVLVGNEGTTPDKPSCALTLSPSLITANGSATATVICQPAATSYTWDAAETNAPAAPASPVDQASLTFVTAGTYTYKVLGVNATGSGPKASATITVQPPAGGPGPLAYRASGKRLSAGTFTYPTGTLPGDWLVLWIYSTVDIPTPVGWDNPKKVSWFGASRWANVFRRQAASETSVSIPAAGSSPVLVMAAYSGGSGWGNITNITETSASLGTCTTSIARTAAQSVIVTAASDRGGATPTVPASFSLRETSTNTAFADRVYGTTGTSSVVWGQGEILLPAVCVSLEILP
jgi:hypothetical protein